MRVLLLHPEDSPRRGPWTEQRWDLIVDLGKSSPFSASAWTDQMRCPVLRLDSFRQGVRDLRLVREMFSAGRGHLLDEQGIDWWDLTTPMIQAEVETVLALRRLMAEISDSADLWATRLGWPATAVTSLRGRPLQAFPGLFLARLLVPVQRYGRLFRRFSGPQIKEIFFDKYDSGYRWRSRFSFKKAKCSEPVVLLPSAYENVSRMAAAYARLLPEQQFLLVATRDSATRFEPPRNVRVQDFAAYADVDPTPEVPAILETWDVLRRKLCQIPEFEVLSKAGLFDPFPAWFRDGLRARNAWQDVLESEPVCGVLCGDDSNRYTRLPVILARKRGLPTLDFHHGAMDGRYLLKELSCDLYLAKSAMERDYLLRVCGLPSDKVVVGAPLAAYARSAERGKPSQETSITFFSEPYENAGVRAEEVYRELLPPLCRLARATGKGVIIKLHPFESASDRSRMVQELLCLEDRKFVTIVGGPLSNELLSRSWFGVTVESTTVMDCVSYGVPCFVCAWLAFSSFEYVQQYARFGIGEILRNADEIADIPLRLGQSKTRAGGHDGLWKMIEPTALRQWLVAASPAQAGVRQNS